MPSPRLELITQDIITTLAGVTTGAGYAFTLTVERPILTGNTGPTGLTVVLLWHAQTVPDMSPGTEEWIQTYYIILHAIVAAESQDTEKDLTTMLADAMKALYVDRRRNGLAIDTLFREIKRVQSLSMGEADCAALVIDVHYRVKDTDPYAPG